MTSTTCTSCGAEQAPGQRFCHMCGNAAPAGCVSCGADLMPGARFCAECGTVQQPVRASSPAVQGQTARHTTERKVTSVLFGDLVGFTTLSESRDQEDVREILSRYFEECRLIVNRYGGMVEKFIGDAVMAVWGVPTAHEDDAERAVRAGLELVAAVTAMGQDVGVPDLNMRVGIVTGEVAVTVGAEQQGMVAGDAVNTASRVQSAADPGEVWVDETTRLLTTAAITYADAGTHFLKGKAEPVPLWSVRAVVAAVGGAERADGLEAPLVGRDRELRLVKELFHATEETARPALLIVDGEPGVGKTRLGWEFFKYIDGLKTITRWHSGRCLAYGDGVAFSAIADAVRVRLAQAGTDEDAELDERIDVGLSRYVSSPDEREWLRPRLAALLGSGSVGTFAREDLYAAWATFFERAGEGLPVVLMIDDAHHADEGLLSFIEYLLSASTFACFVVLLTRPGLMEGRPGLATNRRSTLVHLPTLEPRDMSDLIARLVSGVPDDIRLALVERSEGIPLYAVETVRSLIDRDLVVPRGGQYVLRDPDNLDLATVTAPASLQALVAARLDALSHAQRELVDAASVFGSTFSREALAGLVTDVGDVDAELESLTHLQILSRETGRLSAEFGQYKFVQTVVRQVAYATLSRRDRKAIHLAVVEQYDEAADPSGDRASLVARHLLDAVEAMPSADDVGELQAGAIRLLRKAATRASALGAPAEAAGHLGVALEHATESRARAEILSELARALIDAGRYEEAVERAHEATERFDAMGDELAAAHAAAAEAAALTGNLAHTQAMAVAQPRWDALWGRQDAAHALLALSRPMVLARYRMGEDDRELLEQRIRLAEMVGDHAALADAFSSLSVVYMNSGASALGTVLMDASADLSRKHHLPTPLARALVNLTADSVLYDTALAVEHGQEAVAVAKRAGSTTWVSFAEINLGLALWTRGDWAALDELLGTAVAIAEEENASAAAALEALLRHARGEPFVMEWQLDPARDETDGPSDRAWNLFAESLRARLAEDLPKSLELAMAATKLIREFSRLYDDFTHLWPVAFDLALEVGDDDAAAVLVGLVDSAFDAATPLSVRAHRLRAAGLLAMTDPAAADTVESAMTEAIEIFTRWGTTPYRARAQSELGAWLDSQGRADEGTALLAAAREAFEELGAKRWLEQLDTQAALTRTGRGH